MHAGSSASALYASPLCRREPCSPGSTDWLASTAAALRCVLALPRSCHCRIGDQPLVRVSLHPPLEGSLQPGSTLAGTLDFSQHAQGAAALPAASPGSDAGAAPSSAARCMQVRIWAAAIRCGCCCRVLCWLAASHRSLLPCSPSRHCVRCPPLLPPPHPKLYPSPRLLACRC